MRGEGGGLLWKGVEEERRGVDPPPHTHFPHKCGIDPSTLSGHPTPCFSQVWGRSTLGCIPPAAAAPTGGPGRAPASPRSLPRGEEGGSAGRVDHGAMISFAPWLHADPSAPLKPAGERGTPEGGNPRGMWTRDRTSGRRPSNPQGFRNKTPSFRTLFPPPLFSPGQRTHVVCYGLTPVKFRAGS